MATTMHCVLLLVIKIIVDTHWHKKTMEETYHRLGLKVRCKPMYGAELVPFNSNKRRLGCVMYSPDAEVENPYRHDRSIMVFIMLLSK